MLKHLLLEITWTDRWTVYLTGATLIITLIITLLANHWARRFWHQQKKDEINYQLENTRIHGQLEAAKAAWASGFP